MLPPRSSWGRRRPTPQALPEYLQKAQDTINKLLKGYAKGDLNNEDAGRLEKFLSPCELISIEELRKEMKKMNENHLDPDVEVHPQDVKKKLQELRDKISDAYKLWLSSFAEDGIQFMVGDDPVKQILQPGVFYILAGEPSADDFSRLKRVEARANELLQMTREQLEDDDDDRLELASYLQSDWSTDLQRAFEKVSEIPKATESTANVEDLHVDLLTGYKKAQMAFLEPRLNKKIELRHKRPGEIGDSVEGVVYVPWRPVQLPLAPKSAAPSPVSERELKEFETNINSFLEDFEEYPGKLTKKQRRPLERDLEKAMYPFLRSLRDKYLELRASPSKGSTEYYDAEFRYDQTCALWINSFLEEGLHTHRADSSQPDEWPGLLYSHEDMSGLNETEIAQKLKTLAQNIIRDIPSHNLFKTSPENSDVYLHLINLQYPRLRQKHEAWTELSGISNPTRAEIEARQEAHEIWTKAYNTWVASFERQGVAVLRAVDKSDPVGDPSNVYYRRSLGRHDPESPESPGNLQDPILTRRVVDRAFLLLNRFGDSANDKIVLAARLQAVSGLPPSLMKKLREYNNTRKTPTPPSHIAKMDAFITAFSAWEKKIRDLARPTPISTLYPGLPPKVQEDENEINRLLNSSIPNGVEEERLDSLIQPYWWESLIELQEERRDRLQKKGMAKEDIDKEDMSFPTFAVEFNAFKARRRARGFKIVEKYPKSFVALDSESDSFLLGREQLESHIEHLNWLPRFPSPFNSMNPTQARESIYNMEGKVKGLLAIHHRG